MKLLKGVLLALLFSLLVGLAIGTAVRLRLERPTDYIGELLNDNKQSQRFVARGGAPLSALLNQMPLLGAGQNPA